MFNKDLSLSLRLTDETFIIINIYNYYLQFIFIISFRNFYKALHKNLWDFDKVFNYDEKEELLKIEKEEPWIIDESSLFYDNKYRFSEFKHVGKYEDESLEFFMNSL